MDVPGHRRIYILPQMTTRFQARNGSKGVDLLDISPTHGALAVHNRIGRHRCHKTVLAKAPNIQLDSGEVGPIGANRREKITLPLLNT